MHVWPINYESLIMREKNQTLYQFVDRKILRKSPIICHTSSLWSHVCVGGVTGGRQAIVKAHLNSLDPGRYGNNFALVIFKLTSRPHVLCSSHEAPPPPPPPPPVPLSRIVVRINANDIACEWRRFFFLKIWGSYRVYLYAESERFDMMIICESDTN